MARLRRVAPIDIPQHIIQRGNNRQICFTCDEDMAFYASLLHEYTKKFSVSLHGWVFMTNHIHLLASPHIKGGVSYMMQSVGRRYVRYFNREYRRTGTLWEGRFKASLVQSEQYLLKCQRYIELNPVRAEMVADPAEYVWSSYQCHALGKAIQMSTPHQEYIALGDSDSIRQSEYRRLFQQHVDEDLIKDIRQAVNKGLALGNERFKDEIEYLHNRRVRTAKMGRPRLQSEGD